MTTAFQWRQLSPRNRHHHFSLASGRFATGSSAAAGNGGSSNERVAAGRAAEGTPGFAAELRRVAVADREADAGDVPRLGQEPRPRLVQADLLLERDRRQNCHYVRGVGA